MNLRDKDELTMFYTGLAMQALIEAKGFQGDEIAQANTAENAVRIAKLQANAVEQALKFL